MYIRLEGENHLLVRTVRTAEQGVREVVLADLGIDPELNLFTSAEQGRRKEPELWDGVTDFHLLQALENYKRRLGNYRPALVVIQGKQPDTDGE